MSLVEADSNGNTSAKPSLVNATPEKKSVLISLARKQIEQERTKSGKGSVPATDLKDDSPELQQALDRIDLSNTAGMSADEIKTLESTTHEQAQKKQDESFMKTTVASDMIFYAYARRTDHKDFSRYLLNFANAGIAQEWWELVHAEYPDTERNGPQFFSFKGDDLPGRVWNNKELEHLQTKWFWTRMDDTGGRQQPVIPLQDAKGYVIGYATNTTTAYVGTNIHSSSSTTSSESSTNAANSTHTGSAGAASSVVGTGVGISTELSTVISQQALHLKQVQELIAAQSAQIAAWGQLLSVLLQGGQLTSIQSLKGTEVGANLLQIIASLQLSGGISQGTVHNASTTGSVSIGGAQGATSGSNTVQSGINGTATSDLTAGISNGNNAVSGNNFGPSISSGAGTGLGLNKETSSSNLDLPGNGFSNVNSNTAQGAGVGGFGSSISTTTTTTNQIVTAAAQANSAGHALGFTSGHAAGFAAGLKACSCQTTDSGSPAPSGAIAGTSTGGGKGVGLTSSLNSVPLAQNTSSIEQAFQGGSNTAFGVHYPGQSQPVSNGASGSGGYGAAIHINSSGQEHTSGAGQQGASGSNMSWDQAKTQFGGYGNLGSSVGGQSNNSYSIGTSGNTGGQSGGSYNVSYGVGGSSSGSASLSTTITAGQGGTVNAGRMTFNNTTFSAAVSDVAARRATWLSQSGDSRPYQDIFQGILMSCLNEGRLTLSAGVQSSLNPMIVGGQGGSVNAGQMLISGLTFGAFVDKASTMRSQQLAGLGDMRPIKDIYTGVFLALLAELEEALGAARH